MTLIFCGGYHGIVIEFDLDTIVFCTLSASQFMHGEIIAVFRVIMFLQCFPIFILDVFHLLGLFLGN